MSLDDTNTRRKNDKDEKCHEHVSQKKTTIFLYLLKNIYCTFNSELIKISNKGKVWELDFFDGTKRFIFKNQKINFY